MDIFIPNFLKTYPNVLAFGSMCPNFMRSGKLSWIFILYTIIVKFVLELNIYIFSH